MEPIRCIGYVDIFFTRILNIELMEIGSLMHVMNFEVGKLNNAILLIKIITP